MQQSTEDLHAGDEAGPGTVEVGGGVYHPGAALRDRARRQPTVSDGRPALPYLLACLEIASVRTQAEGDYTNYVELGVRYGGRQTEVVRRALMSAWMEPRIVRVGTFRIDTQPRGT